MAKIDDFGGPAATLLFIRGSVLARIRIKYYVAVVFITALNSPIFQRPDSRMVKTKAMNME